MLERTYWKCPSCGQTFGHTDKKDKFEYLGRAARGLFGHPRGPHCTFCRSKKKKQRIYNLPQSPAVA